MVSLRRMAAVLHSLWDKGDKNPLILPANIPIDDSRVQFELTRYLPDSWVPIIERTSTVPVCRLKLGCVMPGEPPPVFGDALRRLAAAATYLYQDGPRGCYSTQPTVRKLAVDRAEQLKRDPDKVVDPVTWQTIRLSGNTGLAERASKKLKNDELLVVNFAASRLRMEMDRVPLWRGNHVPIRQLSRGLRSLSLPAASIDN